MVYAYAGNLYYEQAVYNYNQTYQIAEIVQYGPAYCPDDYYITSDGIPDKCTDFETLVEQCRKDLIWDAIWNLMKNTIKFATVFVQPLPPSASEIRKGIFRSLNTISTTIEWGQDLAKTAASSNWDPNTTLPPPPEILDNGDGSVAFENQEYADACYQWYLDSQQILSDSLIVWSPAEWEAIYLDNEKQYGPGELHLVIFVMLMLVFEKVSN